MEEIIKQIDGLRECAIEHHRRLNLESIWLFVATTGCWSITETWVQLLAMVIVFYFLYRNVFDGFKLNSTYSIELKGIRDQIDKFITDDADKERLYGQVWKVENEYLTWGQLMKKKRQIFCGYGVLGSIILFFLDVVA